ncbi:MAG TPA: MFS transporter [Cyanobacteria bacterium UBA11149]|nr:MFS transporter [Cyanobacteria bacterium UBA11366]HBR72509.1 MFS transporter [Cyanobacteria bacterium UBA11159]HBS70964.1 MFS transporter [Cyanobacteria bacterium UBA11153]HBW88638.1 MFS transporter [Cyanobacteria bacterium UBA11149]HCA93203.1 MFS transporter [Cyanobacteria bacterium UBA9226]
MFRLGLFQMGLGIMSLLTLGVLNRVMIDELKVLPFVAGGAIAMSQFVSPARVWFGQMSDAKAILGYHRTGYVWLGAVAFTTLSFIALQVIWQLGGSIQATGWSIQSYAIAGIVGLIFALYGLALSASSTPFAALLVDVTDEDNRSQLIAIVWSMLMVGIVVGAIISSKLLARPEICGPEILAYNPTQAPPIVDIGKLKATINPVFKIMPGIVLGLSWLGTVGIEKKYSRYNSRSTLVEREDKITFIRALRVLTANRQTGVFFSFLLVLTLSLFTQDAVMEPYGGEVFGMCISETTKLNVPFGMGTLIGIGFTGFLILPRLGKQQTIKIGCITAAVCSGLFIMAGFAANPGLLKSSLLFFGLASGVLTAAATSLMLDLTAAEVAGTFIGAWGLAQAMARGLATVLGGGVLNLGKVLFSQQPVLAYGLVFTVQAVGMIAAIILLRRISIREFQDNAKSAIAVVMESDLD